MEQSGVSMAMNKSQSDSAWKTKTNYSVVKDKIVSSPFPRPPFPQHSF